MIFIDDIENDYFYYTIKYLGITTKDLKYKYSTKLYFGNFAHIFIN